MSQSSLSAVRREDPLLFKILCEWLEEYAIANNIHIMADRVIVSREGVDYGN